MQVFFSFFKQRLYICSLKLSNEKSNIHLSLIIIFYLPSLKRDDFRKWGWISNVFEPSFGRKSASLVKWVKIRTTPSGAETVPSLSSMAAKSHFSRHETKLDFWISEIFQQIVLMRAGLEASTPQFSFGCFKWAAPVYWELRSPKKTFQS